MVKSCTLSGFVVASVDSLVSSMYSMLKKEREIINYHNGVPENDYLHHGQFLVLPQNPTPYLFICVLSFPEYGIFEKPESVQSGTCGGK